MVLNCHAPSGEDIIIPDYDLRIKHEQAKLNFALITLLKFSDEIENQAKCFACKCRCTTISFFIKEMKHLVYEVFSEYLEVHDKNATCNKMQKLLTKTIAELKLDIKKFNIDAKTEDKISENFVLKFIEFKRQAIQIAKMKASMICNSEIQGYEFAEQLINVILQVIATTWGDLISLYTPECLTCNYSKVNQQKLASNLVVYVTDFFENDSWLKRRIENFKKYSLNHDWPLSITLDFEYTPVLTEKMKENIKKLSQDYGFNIIVRHATHNQIEAQINEILGVQNNG